MTSPSFVHLDPYAANAPKSALTTPVLREVTVSSNSARQSAPSIETFKPFSPLVLDGVVGDSAVKANAHANSHMNTDVNTEANNNNDTTTCPRVGSTALGWSKGTTGPVVAVGNGDVKKSSTMSTD
jgi:hypothetical protein